MRLTVIAVLCFSVAVSVSAQQGSAPDQIFYNGKIATVDSSNSIQEAFAVRGDRILAVGGNKEIQGLKASRTRMVDLRGQTVVPGLQDNHIHPYRYVTTIVRGVDLTGVRSLAELSDRLRQAADKAKPGQTIYATGRWSETDLAEKRGPTRKELDSLVPDHPVLILQRGSNAYLNTAALKAARIDRNTKALAGEPGSVPKDANGEPTGVIVDSEAILDARLVPVEGLREMTLKTFHDLNALGFTSIREPGLPPEIMRLYSSLYRERQLTLRIAMGRDLGPGEADDVEEIVRSLGAGDGSASEWLKYD